MSASDGKLGIIAGGGLLPVAIADDRAASGRPVFVMGLAGWAEADDYAAHAFDTAGVGEIGRLIKRFKEEGCTALTFAGIVRRPDFKSLRVDWRGAKLLPAALSAARKGDDALLRVIVDAFHAEGFTVLGAEDAAAGLRAGEGPLGAITPDERASTDIAKGFAVARALGVHDVGQGCVVCDGLVLAVEAQEGTDAMLARIPNLSETIRGAPGASRGVLVKAPKPIQDRRIDLPTVGVATVEGAAAVGLAGIAVEAGGALIVDRAGVAATADRLGLFVCGVAP